MPRITNSLGRAAGVALVLALVLPLSARANGGAPSGKLVRGELLIRFHDGVGPAVRSRLARAAHAQLGDELPVVPNLWEAFTSQDVPGAVGILDSERGVDYAQPDYLVDFTPDAAPGDQAYWPNDPYFWPAQFANPNHCEAAPPTTQTRLSGWPYWPLGINLTDSDARLGTVDPFQFSPLGAGGSQVPGGNAAFAQYRSIDVLPVWNLLLGQDRLGPPQADRRWTTAGIEHFGVAVMDTGISNHPDVLPEVAAEFSAVRMNVQGERRDELTEFYSDNPGRDDITRLRDLVDRQGRSANRGLSITNPTRRLFPLDDTNELTPKEWSPTNQDGAPVLPTGCDGHGTGDASVIGARANNGIGTAGVGYDVPLIGLRPGMPWDTPPGSANAIDDNQQAALQNWSTWRTGAREDDASVIDRLAVVEALRIPVLNMSFGSNMITQGTDKDGNPRPVILDGAVAEALARTLSTGTTLGVAAAGNDAQQYGTGPAANGHGAIQFPCGLGLAPKLGLWTSPFSRAPHGVQAKEPWRPEVNWKRVQLLCVGATTSFGSALWIHSARGDSAVQLVAPGTNITVATRAGADPAVSSYMNVDGTSVAAPMVSGAASLLRRAAPGAPISAIRAALVNGARPNANLTQSVSYGSLDVACSLRWLYQRRQAGWSMLRIDREQDPAGYDDFTQQTDGCNRPAETVISLPVDVPKSELYRAEDRADSLSAAMGPLDLQQYPLSNAGRWSQILASGSGAPPLGYRPAFPIRRAGFGKPVDPASVVGPVYRLGVTSGGCPRDGYVITGVSVYVSNLSRPPGWAFPTDAAGPPKTLQLAVVVSKPWYHGFIGSPLKLRLSVRCEYYPQATQ